MRRLGCLVVIAVLAAGCATPTASQPAANDQIDVWFTQHMVPYLRQTITVVSLTRPYLTDPALAEAVEGGVIPFKDRLAPKAVLAALDC